MKEVVKTSVFLAAAVVAGAVAAYYRPEPIVATADTAGDEFFPEFEDATAVDSIEVVRYNSDKDEIQRLEIENDSGRWVVASHKNYPADAEDAEQRIRDVALNMMDLKSLDIASNEVADHNEFGVVAPEADSIQQGLEGIGLQINVENEGGKKLAQLIVGKQVKGTEDLRFVRRPGQARVYVAKIDPERLTPQFEDWINSDLLDLNPLDVERVHLKDYTVDVQLRGTQIAPVMTQRFEMAVRFNDEAGEWTLEEFKEAGSGRGLSPAELLESEELNKEKLNELKNALADLNIVDVVSKPQGIAPDLSVSKDFVNDAETIQSLMGHGFFPNPVSENKVELYSSDGEVRVTTKDAVQYVLRFGSPAGVEEREGETMLNRYLIVTAQLNEAALPKPELEDVPEAPAEETPAEDDAPADETAEPDTAAADEDAPEESQAADTDTEQEAPADQTEAPATADDERARVEKENQRKLDEYNEKRKAAEERVKELNQRFADWYYIVPEDVYKKIHLNRFDLIKEKGAAEALDLDDFRTFEQQGLDEPASEAGAAPGPGLPSLP